LKKEKGGKGKKGEKGRKQEGKEQKVNWNRSQEGSDVKEVPGTGQGRVKEGRGEKQRWGNVARL